MLPLCEVLSEWIPGTVVVVIEEKRSKARTRTKHQSISVWPRHQQVRRRKSNNVLIFLHKQRADKRGPYFFTLVFSFYIHIWNICETPPELCRAPQKFQLSSDKIYKPVIRDAKRWLTLISTPQSRRCLSYTQLPFKWRDFSHFYRSMLSGRLTASIASFGTMPKFEPTGFYLPSARRASCLLDSPLGGMFAFCCGIRYQSLWP